MMYSTHSMALCESHVHVRLVYNAEQRESEKAADAQSE